MDKYIGRLLDNRYEILEVIGTGGMAVVYKARCHRLNRLVAIKILKDDYLEDEEFRRRFHSESQAVAMLSHPNIVSIYDVSRSVSEDYIVMELIDGITLKQYMEKKGVLNWKETLHFAIQIAKALEHAHGRGIVHRDIKPHNVMVLKNGSVKVTDFGIARMMSKGNTLTKEALGSVHYISPEQAKGGRVDRRSDIYSLGVVMYEMMSGRPPYDGESPVAIAIKHINGGAVMPSTLNPNIPGGLEQIIMKAMGLEPAKRFDSATQMLKDMDEFRKNPAILFDYNIPPTDEVTKFHHPPLVTDIPEKPTTAERVERKQSGEKENKKDIPAVPPKRRTNGGTPDAPRRRTERKPDKSSNVVTVAIISCCLVMVVALVIFMVVLLNGGVSRQPELVKVPNLVGMDYNDLPEIEDFVIKLDDKVHDNEYPEGQIISQTPEAFDQVEKGKTIYVVISLGKAVEEVFMPNLLDWELAQAEESLKNLSLNLNIVPEKVFDDKIAEGSVVKTDPVANTELQVGQKVTLYVSKGPEIKTGFMPDLVGETKDRAVSILKGQKLDLDIVVEEEFDSVVPVGDVVKTDPESSSELKTGQKVTLYVSKGPQLAKMPGVVGIDVDKAVNLLISSGFKNYQIDLVTSYEEKDRVVKQSVEENTMADVTTNIVLEVSKGTVTKDIVIDLRGNATAADCHVVIQRDGKTVFDDTVKQGTANVTLKAQVGAGPVEYVVMIGGDGWSVTETFDAKG